MDRNELQQKLTQPFDSNQWKEVVETVFPGSQFYSQERTIETNEEIVEQIADKGTVRISDGETSKNIALVEIRLKPGSVHLQKNRVKLRSLVAKLIDQERAHGVVAVFEQGEGDYRLSFIAKEAVLEDGEFIQRETPAKRFTYLLGPGESCRTAAERLFSLSQKQELTLDDITDAFSVEKLNKEFYRHIQKYFYQLVGGKVDDRHDFTGCMTLPSKPIEEQENHKAYSEFAVRLLGRVVFCWFLKHKRCDQDRPLIPEELLSSKAVEEHPGYYHGILEKLFFQTLNKPMNERSKYAPEFAHLIPYLNGGLFDPHKDDFYEEGALGESKCINTLLIPDDWVKELFQTLEMYNFTIDENTALDNEVSIDPEILGRIFENLLAEINPETGDSARKATGSFYTPREIVDYMVEESLLQHLKTALGLTTEESPTNRTNGHESKSGADTPVCDSESAPSSIRDDSCKFVGNNDLEQKLRALFVEDEKPHGLDDKTRRSVVDAFRTIKVLDPACGSGAFPVGILQKMLCALRKVDEDNNLWLDAQIAQIQSMKLSKQEEDRRLDEIDHAFKTNEADYGRKLGIIQNSVYGVDIQPIAIEISKLRFFLTLVVDEKIEENEDNRGILPLPNLDFKFVCANTLIPAPEIENTGDELDLEYYPDFFDDFTALTEQYFYAGTPAEKCLIREQLSNCVSKKIHGELDKVHSLQGEDLFELHGLSKAKQKKIKDRRAKLVRDINLWESYKNIFTGETVGFFDPKYMFPDAADGFDVVLGNPPYVQLQANSGRLAKMYESFGYQAFSATADIYCLFYEKGSQLLRDNGHLCLITSNTWMRAKSCEKLRAYLSRNTATRLLLDLGPDVFETAVVDSNILLCQKNGEYGSGTAALLQDNFNPRSTEFHYYVTQHGVQVEVDCFDQDAWIILPPDAHAIKQKIGEKGIPLVEWNLEIYRGVTTGFNEAFIVDGQTRQELISVDGNSKQLLQPIVRGRDTQRYQVNFADKWLITTFPAKSVNIDNYPAVRTYLESFGKRLEQTGERGSRKKTRNKWFETQDSTAYYTEFDKEKLVWIELVDNGRFSYDDQGLYTEATTYVMTGESIKYLAAVLNSKLISWYFNLSCPTSGVGTSRWKKVYVVKIPIPKLPAREQAPFLEQIEKILALKKKTPEADVSALEAEIDKLVYKLYDLTPAEISIIEGND